MKRTPFELACVLVRLDQFARFIANATCSTISLTPSDP
jgi:hypothetical protein